MSRLLLRLITSAVLSVLSLATAAPAYGLVDPGTGTSYENTRVVVPMTFPVDARQVAAYGYRGKPRLAVPDELLAALPVAELTSR